MKSHTKILNKLINVMTNTLMLTGKHMDFMFDKYNRYNMK